MSFSAPLPSLPSSLGLFDVQSCFDLVQMHECVFQECASQPSFFLSISLRRFVSKKTCVFHHPAPKDTPNKRVDLNNATQTIQTLFTCLHSRPSSAASTPATVSAPSSFKASATTNGRPPTPLLRARARAQASRDGNAPPAGQGGDVEEGGGRRARRRRREKATPPALPLPSLPPPASHAASCPPPPSETRPQRWRQ